MKLTLKFVVLNSLIRESNDVPRSTAEIFEELGSYINFTKEDDVSAATGKESGFVNLFVEGEMGRKYLFWILQGLNNYRMIGEKNLRFKAPVNELGTAAKVLAKSRF